jgi:nucleotide-binding universal stress UspA family protein
MFKQIVCATDGSADSDAALAYAKELASLAGATLQVVHCEEYVGPGGRSGRYQANNDEVGIQAKITRQAAEVEQAGIETTVHVIPASYGHAAHAIADFSRDNDVELIVVGTRGHTPLAGLVLGSVTQRLLHVAPCPVLAVPSRDRRHA